MFNVLFMYSDWKDNLVKDQRFTTDEVARLIKSGQAIDGTKGGLILGRSHDNGGIPVLTRKGDYYCYDKEFEGFEFMFNSAAFCTYESYCAFLNQPVTKLIGDSFKEYQIPNNIRVIDARLLNGSKFLIVPEFKTFVFNKRGTEGFLDTLNEMNNSVSVNAEKNGVTIHHQNPIEIRFFDQKCGTVLGKR